MFLNVLPFKSLYALHKSFSFSFIHIPDPDFGLFDILKLCSVLWVNTSSSSSSVRLSNMFRCTFTNARYKYIRILFREAASNPTPLFETDFVFVRIWPKNISLITYQNSFDIHFASSCSLYDTSITEDGLFYMQLIIGTFTTPCITFRWNRCWNSLKHLPIYSFSFQRYSSFHSSSNGDWAQWRPSFNSTLSSRISLCTFITQTIFLSNSLLIAWKNIFNYIFNVSSRPTPTSKCCSALLLDTPICIFSVKIYEINFFIFLKHFQYSFPIITFGLLSSLIVLIIIRFAYKSYISPICLYLNIFLTYNEISILLIMFYFIIPVFFLPRSHTIFLQRTRFSEII